MMAFPDDTAGEWIDARAGDFSLTRTSGAKANVVLKFTRAIDVGAPNIPAGTIVCTEDGLNFVTQEDAVWSGMTAEVPAEAEEIGRAYNVEENTLTVMKVNVSGLAAVTNPEAAVGGTDDETDAALLERWHEYLQRPESSGNANHYISWAKEIAGIENAAVQPLWNGPGTVKVIVAGPDDSPVDVTVVDEAVAHIEAERPIGATVTVVSVGSVEVNVSATISLELGYSGQEVAEALILSLGQTLLTLPFGEDKVLRYSRALALLLDCDGVEDYSSFTLNEGTANLKFGPEETPIVGTVAITIAADE
jgi:uncharacterized phage protein gp47/JayE